MFSMLLLSPRFSFVYLFYFVVIERQKAKHSRQGQEVGVGRLVSRGKGEGTGGFPRGNQERSQHLRLEAKISLQDSIFVNN